MPYQFCFYPVVVICFRIALLFAEFLASPFIGPIFTAVGLAGRFL